MYDWLGDELKVYEPIQIMKISVRSGIRTHAHRSGLRPERSALDLSAILTMSQTLSIALMKRSIYKI